MVTFLEKITWAARDHGLLIAVVYVVVLALIIYRLMRVRAAASALVASAWRTAFLPHVSERKQVVKAVLVATGTLFLCLALLRPQWNTQEQVVAQQGRDVLIALDISRSMLAQDCTPDRLQCAKRKIKTLVQALHSERVGLLLFSGAPFIECPLTKDSAAFFTHLDQVDVETISSGTTALDEALREALRLFARMPERKNKLVVVFTDGEDFSSNLQEVKQEAHKMGLHIFTIGVGTPEGAPIPLYDAQGKQTGVQQDSKGSPVMTKLNEGILTTLARDSGGKYVRMQKDDTDVAQLVALVERFEKEKFDDKKLSAREEQYPWFLAVSFICFLLEWLL